MFNMGDARFTIAKSIPRDQNGRYPHSWKSFSNITDGTTHTLCLAESITGRPTDFRAAYNGTYAKMSDARRDVATAPDGRDPGNMRVGLGLFPCR